MDICASLPETAVMAPPKPLARIPAMRTLAVGVVGPGKVGSALLAQLREAQPRLRRAARLDLQLRVVADSRRMWLDSDDVALNARTRGAQTWRPSDLAGVGAHLRDAAHALVVDCSASDAVVAHYADWLAAGIHVVTPNKLALSGPLPRLSGILAAAASGGAQLRYEATVGAGLPVVQTLRDLLDTGDELLAVEGMLSGTLAWLFNHYDGQRPFSALVREAHALGYTEPDPRDDLGGMDVARKLVILAREAGHALSLHDVEVDGLVPAALADANAGAFMERLHELDAPLARRHAAAMVDDCVLRYVGHLDRDGRARVGLRALPRAHAFAHTRLTDNIVQFQTRRYHDNPLCVQGPGAGPEVTAAGVFVDVLRVAAGLGAAA